MTERDRQIERAWKGNDPKKDKYGNTAIEKE